MCDVEVVKSLMGLPTFTMFDNGEQVNTCLGAGKPRLCETIVYFELSPSLE